MTSEAIVIGPSVLDIVLLSVGSSLFGAALTALSWWLVARSNRMRAEEMARSRSSIEAYLRGGPCERCGALPPADHEVGQLVMVGDRGGWRCMTCDPLNYKLQRLREAVASGSVVTRDADGHAV